MSTPSPLSQSPKSQQTRQRMSAPNVLSQRATTPRHQQRHSHIILTPAARAELERERSNSFSSRIVKDQLTGALKFKGMMNLRLRARKENRKSHGALLGAGEHLASDLASTSLGEYGTVGLVRESANGTEDYAQGMRHSSGILSHPGVELILSRYLNLLLLLLPFGILANAFNWSPSTVFLLNFFSILPLAQLLGDLTEEVALYTNETIGGLINATLGNATELIISIFAIEKGLLRVVQVSLLGSVLSNQLLVTGCCFFFGGLFHSQQEFNARIASIDSSLLLIAVLGLTVPAGRTLT